MQDGMKATIPWWSGIQAEEVLDLLPDYARKAGNTSEGIEAAGTSLAAHLRGSLPVYPLSGSLWQSFKQEFHLLVCTDDPKYDETRSKLKFSGQQTQSTIVGIVTAGIGSAMGFHAALLVPFCALGLLALVRMGKEAFCQASRITQQVDLGE